jgi:hypothetical protein
MSNSSFDCRTLSSVWYSASNREIIFIPRKIRYLGVVSGKRFDDTKELIKRHQSCWDPWSWRPSFAHKNNVVPSRSYRFATAPAFSNINDVASRKFIRYSCCSRPIYWLHIVSQLMLFHLEGGDLRYPILRAIGRHSRRRWKENTILLE